MSQGTPVAYSVPFDNSTNGFVSDNVQAAIEEARNSGSTNFSYLTVGLTENITIPSGQQMLVNGHVTVLGHLTVDGELIDISNRKPEAFFYDTITVDQCVRVAIDRLLLYKGHLTVLGHLRVQGRLEPA